MSKKTNIAVLAEEILLNSKKEISFHIHSLLNAINTLEFKEIDENIISVDGSSFFYNSVFICKKFKENTNSINRILVHSILHCVLLNPFSFDFKEKFLWDLATDISVENIINDFNLPFLYSPKEVLQKAITENLKKNIKNLSAENIYFYLKSSNIKTEELEFYSSAFSQDDHKSWYKSKNYTFSYENGEETVEARSIYKKADNRTGDAHAPKEKTVNDEIANSTKEISDFWRKITPDIVTDLEALKKQGVLGGVDFAILKSLSREKYDYEKFLKKFLIDTESIEINDDEFDYIFYTYGLNMYENMPIIEPLEYIENKKIKKLFIAIDTSGSVKGETVKNFVTKTYNILTKTTFFSKKFEVHIIQCDAEIQDVSVLTFREEIEKYAENVTLKGFGGTDFNPVFDYVRKIYENSDKNEVTGLIYFTDGDGIFPAEMPKFKTAFIISDTYFLKEKLPPWAIGIYL